MTPLARLALRSLLLVMPPLLVTPSLAGTKLDLSPYVANMSAPGDFKVFTRSTGGQRKVTVIALEPWAKGWREVVLSETTGTGDADGVALYENYLIPGKQLLSGSELYNDEVLFFVRKPAKGLKLLVDPAKPQRLKKKATVHLAGAETKAGTVELRALWGIEGFEDAETPSGDYGDALHARAQAALRARNQVGGEIVQLEDSRLWYAVGLGLVAAEVSFGFYVDGVLEASGFWRDELSSGEIGGVPFPAP